MAYSAAEQYTVTVDLSVAQIVVSGFGITFEDAAQSFHLGDPAGLAIRAYDIQTGLIQTVSLGAAEIVLDAHGVAFYKLAVFVSGARFTVLKPVFSCSGQSPAFSVSAGVKPTATALGISPGHTVSGIKPKATFDAEVG